MISRARLAITPATLAMLLLALAFTPGQAQTAELDKSSRPNFVVILTDDAGYSDIACYGGEIPTPNIDRLAAGGLRFRRFYTNARCSPTRASLLTGQYPHRVGVGDLCRPQDETPYPGYMGYLDPQCVTLPEVLKLAGYQTFMSGKWHLGGERLIEGNQPAPGEMQKWPLARGFDRFFGLIHGMTDYFDPSRFRTYRPFRLGNDLYDIQPDSGFYATQAITDFALKWLDEACGKDKEPFFLYVSYTAPHDPLQAPRERVTPHLETYSSNWRELQRARSRKAVELGVIPENWRKRHTGPERPTPGQVQDMATVAAMLEIVDAGVGLIVQKLKQLDELDNTLIVFLSDNGAAGQHRSLSNTPYYGGKESLPEGGTATHCVVHWPNGVTRSGDVIPQPGHVREWMPTFLELAGAELPEVLEGKKLAPIEGVSLVEALTTGNWAGHETLYWELYGQESVIQGKWKYMTDVGGEPFLIDMENDGAETRNLASSYPKRTARLKALHAEWAKTHQVLPLEVVQKAQAQNLQPRDDEE